MRKETIVSIIWLLLSLFVAVESWRMGLGTFRVPGPGFLSFWVSLIVALLTLALLLQERARKIVETAALFKGKKVTNIILGFVFLFAYPLLLEKIGFSLCNLFFMVCCMKIIAGKNWGITGAVSSGVVIFTYLLFVVWLQLSFPPGEWVRHIWSFGGF